MKKIRVGTAACLTSLVLLNLLASCGEEAKPAVDTQASGETNSAATEAVEETVKTYSETLPAEDFGGKEFRVYTSNELAGSNNPIVINYASETTGEVVNDALYARDRYLEQKYNVSMKFDVDTITSNLPNTLLKSIMAGDQAYHMILGDHAEVTRTLSGQGATFALNRVDGINLDAPYWMPQMNKDYYIGDDLYFVTCAISPRYYGSVYLIMFNRDMARDLNLDDMYEMVNKGTWTIEQMMRLAKEAAADTDGDGTVGDHDRLGMLYECAQSYVFGAGYNFIQSNGGKLVSNMEDPKLIDYMQKMADRFQEFGVYKDGNSHIDSDYVYNNGNCLFFNPCSFVLAEFRDFKYDYGILPMPKQDESQKEYVCISQPWVNVAPNIPVTVPAEELRMTGVLTDALAAYGMDYIRPAVFENVIQLKSTRDEKSAEIVDKIFQNISIDISMALRFGDFYNTIEKFFGPQLGKQDVTSMYASIKNKTEAEIDGIMGVYAQIAEDLYK
ncbi:MAG: hypothetical protein MJ175_06240 [Clostridia bacterium]|nr:hypothetical protein [Clostridia bacterium]